MIIFIPGLESLLLCVCCPVSWDISVGLARKLAGALARWLPAPQPTVNLVQSNSWETPSSLSPSPWKILFAFEVATCFSAGVALMNGQVDGLICIVEERPRKCICKDGWFYRVSVNFEVQLDELCSEAERTAELQPLMLAHSVLPCCSLLCALNNCEWSNMFFLKIHKELDYLLEIKWVTIRAGTRQLNNRRLTGYLK